MFVIHENKITNEHERMFVRVKVITSKFEDILTNEVNDFLDQTNGILLDQKLTVNNMSKHQDRYTMTITYGQHYHGCDCKVCEKIKGV